MRTTSVMIQSLCVPCCCRCRYCLLSWDGRRAGADWARSAELAERFLGELRERRPGVAASFSFGYSMEHPDLRAALRTLRRLGSPTADFLQCDGMRMRDERECAQLMELLLEEGVRELNFTVYGLPAYHDRFAGRSGDHALLLRMMKAAGDAGLPFSTGVPLTEENIGQAGELTERLREAGSGRITLFIPHEEGRGRSLAPVRLREADLLTLSPEKRALLNRRVFRTEREWLQEREPVSDGGRMILVSLRADNIEAYERRSAESVVGELEALDEAYYSAFPGFADLAERYGDPEGDRLYRFRDLYAHYRARYGEEHGVRVYDVTDERFSGSRRT